MPPRNRRAPEVHKFGGASLADSSAVRHAVHIIRYSPSKPAIVVVSAMSGVTDALLEVARSSSRRDLDTARALIQQLRARHLEVAQTLLPSGSARSALLRLVTGSLAELEAEIDGSMSSRELTASARDNLLSRGERLSAALFAAALGAQGVRAKLVDATRLIRTDFTFGQASPDLDSTDQCAERVLMPLLRRDITAVVPGFIGAAPSGELTTLGRGGSDLTATLLARAVGAGRVNLWKDVPGLLTADPRIVPDARVIHQLHTREAAELAYYGAKVLHPRTLIPLAGRRISLYVRPFADPESSGTEVSERATPGRSPVKAISAAVGQALITVTGNGMLGVPGIAARTFAALHSLHISVSLISQASSEHSICFSVPEALAETAQQGLVDEFAKEIKDQEIDGVEVSSGMATIAIVGLGMHGKPGVAAATFEALAAARINVVAIAQGSSELNISIVVSAREAAEAQRRIHGAFRLSRIAGGSVVQPERMELVLLGFGQIGRALAAQLAQVRRPALELHIIGLIDRSGFIFDPAGIKEKKLQRLALRKSRGARLAEISGGQAASPERALTHIASHALTRPVLVDLTADETGPALERALAEGMDLVLANKRPLAGDRRASDSLWQAARARGRRILHEATVGAGLPIIDTYHKLVQSGDRVERIEGLLSGTLGYVLSEVSAGRRFSTAVRRAMELGYTEPDPREDLSGMDVGRKALILARLLGYPGELDGKSVESLVPPWGGAIGLDEFLSRLEELDPEWTGRVEEAARREEVLRYVAAVTARKISVGVKSVPQSSPLAGIRGSTNQVIFTTARYKDHPLVITGPGAGAEVTAAGVLNDILRIAGA
jgi:bifunctional aspartokinase / homoserine dehydrogenase 1